MGRTFCVADLHGHYGLWTQIKEYLQSDDKLFILGDCADRGPLGWSIIKEALAHPQVTYIRGNHDQMLLDCRESDWTDTYLWMCNGGYPTYDAVLQDEKADLYLKQLNKTKFSYKYINTKNQTIHLSHAGFTPFDDGLVPAVSELLWDREHFYNYWPEGHETEYIVHGHTYNKSIKPALGAADKETNSSQTMCRYCEGHKFDLDGRSFIYGEICLFNLDTLEEEFVFKSDDKTMLMPDWGF